MIANNNAKIVYVLILILIISVAATFYHMSQTNPKIPGYYVAFEDGVTEQEVESILENYDLIMNYTI